MGRWEEAPRRLFQPSKLCRCVTAHRDISASPHICYNAHMGNRCVRPFHTPFLIISNGHIFAHQYLLFYHKSPHSSRQNHHPPTPPPHPHIPPTTPPPPAGQAGSQAARNPTRGTTSLRRYLP